MSAGGLAMATAASAPTAQIADPVRDERWLRAAKLARRLSWASLLWMSIEGIAGLAAGLEADSLSLLVWAGSSFVEGLASMTIIWRFTGSRVRSETSERTAQRWIAGSFLLLVPYFLYESFDRLLNGSDTQFSGLGAAVTASAIVLMPLLGWAKLRLSRQLGSGATAGEGVQNLLCAAQAAVALVALAGAGAGLGILDPVGALLISAVAVKECSDLWRGDGDACCQPAGFADPAASAPPPRPAAGTGRHCAGEGCCTPAMAPVAANADDPVRRAAG